MRWLCVLVVVAACHHPHAASPPADAVANTVPGVSVDPTVDRDVRQIVGGMFSVDEIGPEAYDKLVRRVKAAPVAYLEALEQMGATSAPEELASIYPDALLTLTRPVDPGRTAEACNALIQRYTDASAKLSDERLGMRLATMHVILDEATR